MKRFKDHLNYYFEKIAVWVQDLLMKMLVAISFLMIFFYFGYIVYFSTVCYDTSRIIVGSLALFIMIHLNKSLQGR